MVFSSFIFLFIFLPLALGAYYLAPHRHRNAVLLTASLAFYAWGAPKFVFVLVAGTWADWQLSRAMGRADAGSPKRRRLLIASLVMNLSLLGWFKYANFGVEEFNLIAKALGFHGIVWTAVVLPVGISFFTFHKISYVVDVYRGTSAPAESFGICLLYIVLFPQLIAGPIVRYHDVDRQLVARSHTTTRFVSGICRFCMGMAKKVLIANVLGETADAVFNAPAAGVPASFAWIGVLAYSFQIYFDFSGYSDMAIGLGRMFGIEFLENFDRPYLARDFTEFWQRWHISLSRFMREYLYIPLGGNRVAPLRRYLNLWIVFLLSGFWHGASWNFIVWGAYQGLFLSLDKLFWSRIVAKFPRALAMAVNFFLVCIGWVFFRAENLDHALALLHRMFTAAPPADIENPLLWAHVLGHRAMTMMIVAALICFLPAIPCMERCIDQAAGLDHEHRGLHRATAVALLLLVLSFCSLANSGFNPFIYFRF